MAQEIRHFQVLIPHGTAKTAGFSADMSFPPRFVSGIQIRVPPGPRGEVGFAIGSAGQAIIPYQQGQYIVTDDEIIDWALEGYVQSGSWTLFGYNTGQYDHTIYITFLLAILASASTGGGTAPIPGGDLGGGTLPGGGVGAPPPLTLPPAPVIPPINIPPPPNLPPPVIPPPTGGTPPPITPPGSTAPPGGAAPAGSGGGAGPRFVIIGGS